jgi:DNA mismatch repair protein MutS2
MDDKNLQMLEFPRIREILAGFTSFPASRELAVALKPHQDYDYIMRLLRQSAEARQLLATEHGFAVGNVPDIRNFVIKAEREGILEPLALLDIQSTLSSLHQLRSDIRKVSGDYPLLWDIAGSIVEIRDLEKEITRCIDPSGEVLDSASPALTGLRQQLRATRSQITERLQSIIRSSKAQQLLQDDIITEREGRNVILVKIERRHEIKGIVHDISNTEATVFVEPQVTVGLGNALRELVIEEKHEVERILATLSAGVGSHSEEITRNVSLAAQLDFTLAKAKYASKLKAVEPVILPPANKEPRLFKLVDARHPLLGDKAVPFSLEIGRDFSGLVITGPNTGGKTVTLKTLGLLCLMAQSGLPIPASSESSLPIFDNVFADIGDEQSIEQTLSTFSWHMGNIVHIIKGASNRSMVLLDELGTSTDPAEGSALARAILRYFLARQTFIVVTTHYSDLKAFAHVTPGLQNASLEFDPRTLAPTYHLTVGLPGGSNAMAIASHLGVPAEIIDDARSMLTQGSQELEVLLGNLGSEKQKTELARQELVEEKKRLERKNTDLADERERLKNEERKAVQVAKDNLVREAAELHKELRQASADLRKEKSAAMLEQARQSLASVRERLKGEVWQVKSSESEAVDNSPIIVGDTVLIKEVGLQATVLSVSEDTREIEVQAGRTRLQLGLDAVEKIVPSGIKAPAPASYVKPRSKRQVSLELDLRGKRADEVEWALDAYLDDAVQANLNEVRIIHGYGTGTVRNIVRDFLASHTLVKSFRSGERNEGGDGVTIARL